MSITREKIYGFVGPMYSRKTLLMLDLIGGLEAVGRNILVFKPNNDTRFGLDEIRSRNGGSHAAIAIPTNQPGEIIRHLKLNPNTDLVAIDEIQFMAPSIEKTILTLAGNGIQVAYTGLNRNYRGEAFTTMGKIMPLTTELQQTHARCMFTENNNPRMCGMEAPMTQRLFKGFPDSFNSSTVIIDNTVEDYTYQARCLIHWTVPDMPFSRKIF